MGLIFGLLKKIIKLTIYISILLAVIVFIPNLPPYTKFTSIILEPSQPRIGPLAPNGVLNKAERVYVDKLLGPEAFEVHKGELYTSLATGEIVKASPGGHVTFVTKLGQPCTGLTQEHICGRPLGFKIDENNVMYVADAYLGLWKVDLKNDKKQLLVSPRVAIEGRAPKLVNSITLSKNGDLYWTDSTSDFQLKDGAISSLSDPSGRVLQYNPAKNQSKVLMDNLWFPNGIAISPDNQFLVIVETLRFRLLKYYINGPNKGKSEVFVAGLPGLPDNIRALPDGSGLLVGLYATYDDENPILTRSLAQTPLVRKLFARLQRLVEIPFEYLYNIYPHVVFEDIVYNIGHFKSISYAMPTQSGLLVVDWNGNIVESYYNTDGSLGHISDAIVYNNRLYTGAPHLQNFIGSVPVPPLLKKAFENKPETAAPKQQMKPAETAPKLQEKPVKAPKPKVEEKPKVEVKREATRPVVQEKPPQKQTKPVEAAKPPPPAPAPKPTPKPVEQPKPAQQKPAQTKPEPSKAPTPSKQEKPTPKPEKPTPKPEVKAPSTPKATVKPTTQTPPLKKTPEIKTTPKPQVKAKKADPEPEFEMPIITRPKQEAIHEMKNKLAPENIPISEEIPSDTAKPSKDTLKVIKKDGPAEIPNPLK